MKRSMLIALLAALVVTGVVAACKFMPRELSYSECSSVYRHFADMQLEGVRVTYVRDKVVNDTLRLPVTLLEATTDSAWNGLVKEFNFGDQFNAELPSDTNAVSFWFAPRNHYNLPMDSTLLNNDIVVASQYRKTMAVFHITSEDQVNAIVFRQIVNVKPQ